MKLGVLTYHRADNYGAYMQAYALTMKFRGLGIEAEIIDYNMNVAEKQYRVANKNPINRYYEKQRHNTFKKAIKGLPLSKRRLISDDISCFVEFVKNEYDIIVAGSDEIWKLDSFRGFPNPYWLIGDLQAEKYAYAASSRSNFQLLSEEDRHTIKNTLKDFKIIGVRDEYTYKQLKLLLDSDVAQKLYLCCDPTFLYDFKTSEEKGKAILETKVDKNKKTIVLMLDDKKIANEIRKTFKNKVNLVAVYRKQVGYKNFIDLTPFEWAEVISAADILVTKYFHGVCFALKNNTKFVAIDSREKNRENGKIYDLLNRENLLEYFLSTQDENYMSEIIKKIDNSLDTENIDFTSHVQHQVCIGDNFFDIFVKENNLSSKEEIC